MATSIELIKSFEKDPLRIRKDIAENLKWRIWLTQEGEREPELGAIIRQRCASDFLFYINAFWWAEDPFADKGGRHGIPRMRIRPIITYPYQDEFALNLIKHIDDMESVIADKSRDMLATYLVLSVGTWGWLFKGWKGLITSWKETEVDGAEDTSTLFGKIKLMFLQLAPSYLLPKGFNYKQHVTSCSIQNPETKATIMGTAAGPNIGSGRREDWVFLDEFSKWLAFSSDAWRSLSHSTGTKIVVYTPRGVGNFSYTLMKGDIIKNKYHLYWYLHPEKCFTTAHHYVNVKNGKVIDKINNYIVEIPKDQSKAPSGCYVDQFGKIRSEWYDKKCLEGDANDIAENIDCNYLTTGSPYFDVAVCEKNLRLMARSPLARGNLVWITRPVFDSSGYCTNKGELQVEFVPSLNGKILLWEYPRYDYEYGYNISADISEGLEDGDFTSASCRRRIFEDFNDKLTVVASLHARLPIWETAEELVKMGIYFDYAYLSPESNKDGSAVIISISRIYDYIWHKDVLTKGVPESTDKLGFSTSNRHVKHSLLGELQTAIAKGMYIDPDPNFWEETMTFVYNDGKLEAQGKSAGSGVRDDVVMDRAIGYWTSLRMPSAYKKIVKEKQRNYFYRTEVQRPELIRW